MGTTRNDRTLRTEKAAIVALVVGVILLTSLWSTAFGDDTTTSPIWDFGCDEPMNAHNADCGAATSNLSEEAHAPGVPADDGLAPWCEGETDLTVYGCGRSIEAVTAGISTDPGPALSPGARP